MIPVFSMVSLVDLLAFMQGTLLGVLLMLKKKEHVSFFLLGLFLFSYSTELFSSALFDTPIYSQAPGLLYLPVTFYFLFMPSLYLYVKSLTGHIIWEKYIWLFLPALFEFLMILILFFQSKDTKLEQFNSGWVSSFHQIYVSLAMVYSLIYAFFILRLIHKHKERVENYYSNVQGKLLVWVKWICIFIIIIDLILFSVYLVPGSFFNDIIYPVISAVNVVFIFWVALSGFRQSAIELKEEEIPKEKKEKEDILESPDSISLINKHLLIKEYETVLALIKKKKTFNQPDLNLSNLATQLHLSQRKLSVIIKEGSGKNFKTFVNSLRIEESKKLLNDEAYAHLKIVGIAYEVGFNSKSTFYTAFKKEVGVTPVQFQEDSFSKLKSKKQ